MNKWLEIEQFLLPFKTCKLYVACSGGLDSMSLLHYLHFNNYNVVALHINYHKRGIESDLDEKLVENYCRNHAIPFFRKDFNSSEKGNFQEIARNFRYDFFETCAADQDAKVVLAHHRDDVVETFMQNLVRKSGIRGLASIPRQRDKIIRPFIHLSKEEIQGYAVENSINWRDDMSNFEDTYTRNKWRNIFLPQLTNINPAFNEQVLTIVKACQDNLSLLKMKVKPIADLIREQHVISKRDLIQMSSEELFELWYEIGQPSSTFHRFEELLNLQEGKRIEGKDWLDHLLTKTNNIYFIPRDRANKLPEIRIEKVKELPLIYDKHELFLDGDKIDGQLQLRYFEESDYISPIGMQQNQKVSKILKDAKIPSHLRKQQLILHDNSKILWVVGLKISRAAVASERSSSILAITLI